MTGLWFKIHRNMQWKAYREGSESDSDGDELDRDEAEAGN